MLESVWQEHKRSPHGWSALHNHLPLASAILKVFRYPLLRLIGHRGDKGVLTPLMGLFIGL